MEWTQLISNKRFGQEHKHAERHDDRSEFKRDYDRLIFSSAFRRLPEAPGAEGYTLRGNRNHRECSLPGARSGQSSLRSFRRKSHPDFLQRGCRTGIER